MNWEKLCRKTVIKACFRERYSKKRKIFRFFFEVEFQVVNSWNFLELISFLVCFSFRLNKLNMYVLKVNYKSLYYTAYSHTTPREGSTLSTSCLKVQDIVSKNVFSIKKHFFFQNNYSDFIFWPWFCIYSSSNIFSETIQIFRIILFWVEKNTPSQRSQRVFCVVQSNITNINFLTQYNF